MFGCGDLRDNKVEILALLARTIGDVRRVPLEFNNPRNDESIRVMGVGARGGSTLLSLTGLFCDNNPVLDPNNAAGDNVADVVGEPKVPDDELFDVCGTL